MRPLAAPSDKRFRRAQVKPGRKRSAASRRAWLAIRVVTVLLVALYGGWRGTMLVLGASALRVSEVSIRGNERLSLGEIRALLDGAEGHNILAVDLADLRARLLASPWVETAQVRRILPAGIDVEIRERRPIGVARLAGALYLVDATGVVIDEYGPNYGDLDLPLIDGLGGKAESGAVVAEAHARLAARVVAALHARPDIGEQVSQIDVSDAHNAVVILDGDTTLLRLGDDDFAGRIQSYLELAPALRERVRPLDYVDLRFGERVYVREAKQ